MPPPQPQPQPQPHAPPAGAAGPARDPLAAIDMPEDERSMYALARSVWPSDVATPQAWAPVVWAALHAWALFKYPVRPTDQDRARAAEFLQQWFTTLVLCGVCEFHFKQAMRGVHAHTASRFALSRFLVDVHNEVNRRTGKPVLTHDDVVRHYARLPQASRAFSETLRGARSDEPNAVERDVAGSRPVAAIAAVCAVVGVALVCFIVYVFAGRVLRGKPAPPAAGYVAGGAARVRSAAPAAPRRGR